MWTVIFTPRSDAWLQEQEEGMQEKVLADLSNLENYGPKLSRPYADSVKGSRHKKHEGASRAVFRSTGARLLRF